MVSRSLGVTAATLTARRDAFLAAGEAALTTRPAAGADLESERLKARLGAALIERDLLHKTIAILEANRPLARRRPYGRAAVCRAWRLARSGVTATSLCHPTRRQDGAG